MIILYGTGEGLTDPVAETDGVAQGIAKQTLPVVVEFVAGTQGIAGTVQYAGSVPGLVNGVMQVNVKTPGGLRGRWPMRVSVGTFTSPIVEVVFGDQ